MQAVLQVYQGVAQGLAAQAASAISGANALETASGGPLEPLGSALAVHSPTAGEQFLDALHHLSNPQNRLAEILDGRSPAQLKRITYSLLKRNYGLRMKWPTTVGTATRKSIQDVLEENVGPPPEPFEREVMRRMFAPLAARHRYETLFNIGLMASAEMAFRDLPKTIVFFLTNVEGVITLFFEWMRETDRKDLMASCSPTWLSWLSKKTDRVFVRLVSDWPPLEGRSAADESFILSARTLLRFCKEDFHVYEALDQLEKKHPQDHAYFEALRRLLSEFVWE